MSLPRIFAQTCALYCVSARLRNAVQKIYSSTAPVSRQPIQAAAQRSRYGTVLLRSPEMVSMTFWVKTEKPSIAEALHAIPSIDNRKFSPFPSYSADLHVAEALHSVEVIFLLLHMIGVPFVCFEAKPQIRGLFRIHSLYPYCKAFCAIESGISEAMGKAIK